MEETIKRIAASMLELKEQTATQIKENQANLNETASTIETHLSLFQDRIIEASNLFRKLEQREVIGVEFHFFVIERFV